MRGLNDTSNPNYPIIADGLSQSDTTVWTNQEGAPGAVWKGKTAIVVRVDGSGAPHKLNATFALFETSS